MRTNLTARFTICVLAVVAVLPGTVKAVSLPTIAPGAVVSASAFGGFTSIAPGSWIEIYGSNLAASTRSWAGSDFTGVNAPTSLDGTRVTIGGQLAFIDYISPGQVNAQVPSNVGSGQQQVIVTTAAGASSPYSITVNAVEPGLLAPQAFNIGGKQYVAALFSDGVTYVLPPGAIPGLPSRRAQPGDTITFYGVGFGSVIPNIPAGQIVQQVNSLSSQFQIKFGQTPATVSYDGLAPNVVGLYQFNVVVPSVPSSDAVPLTFTLGGVAGAQTLYIPVLNGNAGPQAQSLTLSPTSVSGGGTVQGTVTLSGPAPTGGAVVGLSSSSSVASVPAAVTVPVGATAASFVVTTFSVSSNQTATITAAYGGGSAQATLTVTPTVTGSLADLGFVIISGHLSDQPTLGVVINLTGPKLLPNLPCFLASGTGQAGLDPNAVVFGAGWDHGTANGLTVTCGELNITGSVMTNARGDTAQITSGTLTFTLSPQVVITSGTVTGSFSVTSTLATVSKTFSGTYVAP